MRLVLAKSQHLMVRLLQEHPRKRRSAAARAPLQWWDMPWSGSEPDRQRGARPAAGWRFT